MKQPTGSEPTILVLCIKGSGDGRLIKGKKYTAYDLGEPDFLWIKDKVAVGEWFRNRFEVLQKSSNILSVTW